MSDIWHTVDETPKLYEDVAFYVDGYLYFSSYEPQYNQYGIFGADKVEKWCYSKELSSYILALETELERTRKALEIALDAIDKGEAALIGCEEADDKYISDVIAEDGLELLSKAYKQITALTKGGDNE